MGVPSVVSGFRKVAAPPVTPDAFRFAMMVELSPIRFHASIGTISRHRNIIDPWTKSVTQTAINPPINV